ncbi:hypothetical protein LCGC14_0984190 [marine sediment metagenome]|uniref:Uncharacterized protein n=1 Tax=marine sediment metagenome TaxID=412755 RepID=A0A0F9NU53_9ZZZZ
MAGNTRGKLKEKFEGVHRNCDWSIKHCQEALALIGDKNPALTKAITSLGEGIKILDELAQDVYSKI